MIQIGDTDAWLWVAIERIHHQILGVYISRHRNTLVAEVFLRILIKLYGKHIQYILMEDHGILKHVLL
jgi:transposase-like protein